MCVRSASQQLGPGVKRWLRELIFTPRHFAIFDLSVSEDMMVIIKIDE